MTIPQDIVQLASTIAQHGVEQDIVRKVLLYLGADPDNPDLWVGLATALRRQGHYKSSLEIYYKGTLVQSEI